MSSIDYMHACNLMKSLHLDKGNNNSATSYRSLSEMRDFTTERRVCRDSLEALDEFVLESKMNMELDILEKRYTLDLRTWEESAKKDVIIPRSYETECVALFRIEHGISSHVDDEWTIDDLRKSGELQDDVSDAEFLSSQFQKLDIWYESNMKVDIISANRAWSKFSRTESFLDVMDLIQESTKAIEWRRQIHLHLRKESIFSEIDAEHDGFHVKIPWIQIIPEPEQPE